MKELYQHTYNTEVFSDSSNKPRLKIKELLLEKNML